MSPGEADALDALRERTARMLFEDAEKARRAMIERLRAELAEAVAASERGGWVDASQLAELFTAPDCGLP